MGVASCADSSSELRPPSQQAVACRRFPGKSAEFRSPEQPDGDGFSCGRRTGAPRGARATENSPRATGTRNCAGTTQQLAQANAGARSPGAGSNGKRPQSRNREYNPEHRTGNPTLEPATELEQLASIDQPSHESTSNPEPSATVEVTPLDADALTQPAVETELPAVEAELPAVEEELSAAPATTPEETPAVAAATHAPAAHAGEPVR